jgi:hypothetical protein
MLKPVDLWKPIKESLTTGFVFFLASGFASMLTGQQKNIPSY